MNPKKKVVVLGAGVTGLAAAYRLSRSGEFDISVVDRAPRVGGLCSSFKEGDFILDHGPHKFYTLIDGISDDLKELMGEDLLVRDKNQKLFMCRKYFAFPLKMSEMVLRFPPVKTIRILLSYAVQVAKNLLLRRKVQNYEGFIKERFGSGLYRQIFEPLAKKVYGEPSSLDKKLAEVRISSPGLVALVKQLLFRSKIDKTVSAASFHYPKYGYGMIPERLREKCEEKGARFYLSAQVLRIDTAQGKISAVHIKNKEGTTTRLDCDELVYTISPAVLPNLLKEAPREITEAAKKIKFRNTIVYYYLLKSKPVLPAMWVFYPESQFRFGRLSEMSKFSPYTTPEGHTALMVDFTCVDDDPTWSMDDNALGDFLQDQLKPLKLFNSNQVVKRFSKRFKDVYPEYCLGFQDQVGTVRKLEKQFGNLYFIGRLGDFNYNNADQCFDMGFQAADQILKSGHSTDSWQKIRQEKFEHYRIVD